MKERQSNIELLRIIAMFLVLLVHADFYSLGVVTPQDIRAFSLDSVLGLTLNNSLTLLKIPIFSPKNNYITFFKVNNYIVHFFKYKKARTILASYYYN